MEEMIVFIESTKIVKDNKMSAWFTLPIDKVTFEKTLGIDADSTDYQITEMKLPFYREIQETTKIDTLNDMYDKYEALKHELQKGYESLIEVYTTLEELYEYRDDIVYYKRATSLIDVAIIRSEEIMGMEQLPDVIKAHFDFEKYGEHLKDYYTYIRAEDGMYECP